MPEWSSEEWQTRFSEQTEALKHLENLPERIAEKIKEAFTDPEPEVLETPASTEATPPVIAAETPPETEVQPITQQPQAVGILSSGPPWARRKKTVST